MPGCTPYVAPLAKRSPEEDEKHPVVPGGLDDDMLFDYDGHDGKVSTTAPGKGAWGQGFSSLKSLFI